MHTNTHSSMISDVSQNWRTVRLSDDRKVRNAREAALKSSTVNYNNKIENSLLYILAKCLEYVYEYKPFQKNSLTVHLQLGNRHGHVWWIGPNCCDTWFTMLDSWHSSNDLRDPGCAHVIWHIIIQHSSRAWQSKDSNKKRAQLLLFWLEPCQVPTPSTWYMLAASFILVILHSKCIACIACKMLRTDYQNKILTRKILLIFIVLF